MASRKQVSMSLSLRAARRLKTLVKQASQREGRKVRTGDVVEKALKVAFPRPRRKRRRPEAAKQGV
jgi:hypothetical protein